MKIPLPARSFLIALAATFSVWGVCLSSKATLSPVAVIRTIHPDCRAAGPGLTCRTVHSVNTMEDSAAPAWQNAPADYFYRHARLRGEPRPHWNPYTGSGFPIALDGHNAATSPTQWFSSHVPGDQGRDIVTFGRFLLWTFAITWCVALSGASSLSLGVLALAATLAPYGGRYIDIVFLDADLLSPWFLLILLAHMHGRLSLRAAAGLAVLLGLVVGSMAFQQAHVALCFAMGLVGLAAAPATRGRSLWLSACLGAGVLAVVPSWLPLVCNLDQFISARSVQCIAAIGVGKQAFVKTLLHPSFDDDRFMFVTAVGAALLLFAPVRLRFLVVAFLAMGTWEVFGVPSAACRLPLISGIRYVRHFQPHLQMLFIVGVGITISSLCERIDAKGTWVVFAAALLGAGFIANEATDGWPADWATRLCMLAALLGLLGAGLMASRFGAVKAGRATSSALIGAAVMLAALTPLAFGSRTPVRRLELSLGAPEAPALPDEIDSSTALGMVQRRSQEEDRRHASPGGFLYPNWSEALGILDIVSLNAFYPIGYHELNGGLFEHWERDPIHILKPDRFVPVEGRRAFGTDFQRVLAVNRVSLLTFESGNAFFATGPSPYKTDRCHLLARSPAQGVESYVCPDVGGIGFFPRVVNYAHSRAGAIAELKRLPATELVDSVWLGPEVDLSIGTQRVSTAGPAAGKVIQARRASDELSYQLEVEHAGIFAITDSYFRGWTATVNGEPAGISRSNVAFKAVRVPTGKVNLKLTFAPVVF